VPAVCVVVRRGLRTGRAGCRAAARAAGCLCFVWSSRTPSARWLWRCSVGDLLAVRCLFKLCLVCAHRAVRAIRAGCRAAARAAGCLCFVWSSRTPSARWLWRCSVGDLLAVRCLLCLVCTQRAARVISSAPAASSVTEPGVFASSCRTPTPCGVGALLRSCRRACNVQEPREGREGDGRQLRWWPVRRVRARQEVQAQQRLPVDQL
jgi:hypothetical protein